MTTALDLAESIAGPARYKFDELVSGIAIEQQRLAARPYATILWQRVLDFEGLTDWLYLGNSFDDAARASAFISAQIDELRTLHTRPNSTERLQWRADPTWKGPTCPAATARQPLSNLAEQSLILIGDEYNRIYYRAQVLGSFPGNVVGSELFAAVGGSRQELWAYLVAAGEAHATLRERPSPLAMLYG